MSELLTSPPGPPVVAYVALGANLGDAQAALHNAVAALDATPGVSVHKRSAIYRTAPIDASGPDYLNAVVEVKTTLQASSLLDAMHQIEEQAGRARPYRNAPRTLDLDLLLYADLRLDSPKLTLPHPRMTQRAFVLVPLAEIAPALVTAAQLESVASQAIERVSSF